MEETEQTNRFAKDNQSTDKVLAIIELLSYSKEPMRLIDIANQLHYNTSTTLRFLNSLERNGYVYKDRETLKYQMTYKPVSYTHLTAVAGEYCAFSIPSRYT